MLSALFSLEHQRKRLADRLDESVLADFMSVPFPAPGTDCREVRYAALDLETTGLDPKKDEIISVGIVSLEGLRIDLSTAGYWLVAPQRAIPEASAVIHRITDDKAAQGMPLSTVLETLLPRLAGRVLIAHFSSIELGFLKAACKDIFGGRFIIPAVDTYQLAKRRLEQHHRIYRAADLRLSALRAGYNLPRYHSHNALSDAVAAAELFLAQVMEQETRQGMPLRKFLCRTF